MKFQRGDAGVGILVVMAVMMIGVWVFSGHGGGGHHSRDSVTAESEALATAPPSSNAAPLALPAGNATPAGR